MDLAFNDPKYKEARELVKSGNTVKLYIEDLKDYKSKFPYERYIEAMRRPAFEQIINTFDELKVFCKYLNRIGMSITKIEVIE